MHLKKFSLEIPGKTDLKNSIVISDVLLGEMLNMNHEQYALSDRTEAPAILIKLKERPHCFQQKEVMHSFSFFSFFVANSLGQ